MRKTGSRYTPSRPSTVQRAGKGKRRVTAGARTPRPARSAANHASHVTRHR